MQNQSRGGNRGLGGFGRDRAGAVAPIFAAILVPLILAGGVGLDIARKVAASNSLQDSLDAAGLALAHMPSTTPLATLQANATTWVATNLNNKDLSGVTVTVSPSSGQIVLTANGTINTTLMALAGFRTMSVQAQSTVRWAPTGLELALVLDNTGSMANDNKLTSLQSAAASLVDSLSSQWNADPTALKIGVVPFSIAVNVGSQYQNANWITGTQPTEYGADLFSSPTNRFALFNQMGVSWAGCVEDRPMPYDVQDDAPTASNKATLFVPFFAPDEPDGTWSIPGYIGNVSYFNDYTPDIKTDKTWFSQQSDPVKYTKSPTKGNSWFSGYPLGPNSGCGIASLLRLTSDMTQVKAKLNQMVANGETHIPLGLVWGWHVLSPNAPFADGAAYGANITKVTVLVTDGQNTYISGAGVNGGDNSAYTGIGYIWQNRISTKAGSFADPVSALNDRLSLLCSNMKAKGIIIYTVPVEVTDPTIKGLLQNCASSPDKYIDVSNSSGLSSAFANIAGSIGALRVAK